MDLESFNTSRESLVPLLALSNKTNKNIIIFPTDKEAIEFATDFSNLNKNIYHLPSWDTLSYDSFAPSLDIQGKRLEIAHLLLTTETYNIATSIKAISQRIYFEELEICKISLNEEIDFDLLIATPNLMPKLAKLGRVLGPKGLMPSPKSGTVSNTLEATITEFKKGKFEYKADKTGVVHISFGKANFTEIQLIENLRSLYKSIEQNRPSGVKGKYFKTLYICSSMGPSIQIELDAFTK